MLLNNFKITSEHRIISSVPEGADALIIAELARVSDLPLLHIIKDDARMSAFVDNLAFFAPDIEVIAIPAWDCLPYDRVSPACAVTCKRLGSLAKIASGTDKIKKHVIVTTVNSIVQLVVPAEEIIESYLQIKVGDTIEKEKLINLLIQNGYLGTVIVTERGEFASRGSIIDIYPPQFENPLRLDFFGNTLEQIKIFDPVTQLTDSKIEKLDIIPASEIIFSSKNKKRFSDKYREMFGAVTSGDMLYESVLEGRKYAGIEHWQPLFYEKMVSIFDYLPTSPITFDTHARKLLEERFELINDYYNARLNTISGESDSYNPLPPELLYFSKEGFDRLLEARSCLFFSQFREDGTKNIDVKIKGGENFYLTSKQQTRNPFDLLKEWRARQGEKRIVIACNSEGSKTRVNTILAEHNLNAKTIDSFNQFNELSGSIGVVKLNIRNGFEVPDFTIISEQDILGERISRNIKKKLRPEKFLTESYNLSPGEIIVHEEHGIGRFEGLETLFVSGKGHDCLKLIYAGGDRLFIPVENIDVISRYGNSENTVELDRLGSASWQGRKAKLKERIKLAAEEILRIAALREVHAAERISPYEGLYDEFCARFPYTETEDQLRAIEDISSDLISGKPMNRLVCGDVGFGKTEVAMRAAFIALGDRIAGNKEGIGGQVAIIAPTTLLCRQHYKTFTERFANLPVKICQLSRMVNNRQAKENRHMISSGEADIVIGTHALLAKNITFNKLSLIIIDEEQHFGVVQKEHLKKLRSETHVLALSATPIPRTLQMSLTGIRELSLIATPPVDRLAVRTYVMPFDSLIIREAILREKNRGGRTFYVCPRIKDLDEVSRKLERYVPEVKFAIAHGKLKPQELDKIMNEFFDGKYDVLLSTSIIESGIDIATANTLIVHHAEMFGLSQLYQLRGRVGRSNVRAYSYFTTSSGKLFTKEAIQRLEVMQKLDSLGAGFTLATYDMDIRGFGNLLGDEQSGNIKEVGIELYQQMLQDAINELKRSKAVPDSKTVEHFSPQINLGISVLIPEKYIPDLTLRLGLYRRIADLRTPDEIEAIAAELIDRFGPIPEEVEHLLQVVKIKQMCRQAGIEKLEAGPKGALLTFRNNSFAKPDALIKFISENIDTIKLRPDHKLVLGQQDWDNARERIEGLKKSVSEIIRLAA